MTEQDLVMDFSEYAEIVHRAGTHRPLPATIAMAGLGLAGEAGEVADEIKKVMFHDKPVDEDKLCDELGDVLWYFTLIGMIFGIPFHNIYQNNLRKLAKRRPDEYPGFDPETLEPLEFGKEETVVEDDDEDNEED